MVRTSSRSQLLWALVIFALAVAYGIGPGGDQLAVVIIVMSAICCKIIGLSFIPLRLPASDNVRAGVSSRSVWPILGALTVLFLSLAFIVNGWYMVLAAALGVWAIGGALGQAWREDMGWRPHYADRLGERIVRPIGLPLVALLGISVVAISVSRVFLANSEHVAVVVAIVLASVIMVVISVLASMKRVSPSLLVGLSVIAVLITVSMGVFAADAGSKEEEHGESSGAKAPEEFTFKAQNTTYVTKLGRTPPAKLEEVDIPANTKVEFVLRNFDEDIFHNVALYSADGTKPIETGTPVVGGETARNTFVSPKAGTYVMRCDFHPTMTAQVVVEKSSRSESEKEH